MDTIWLYTLLSVIGVSLVSFIGVVALSVSLDRLKRALLLLVSFAAGSLLGGAILHLLPEVFEEADSTNTITFLIIAGIVAFFALEKFLHWRHCHEPTSEDHPHPVGMSNLIGDGFHNLLDGMIIAGAYLVDVKLGVATTVAVILHEIPQEIGDFSILIHAGYSKAKALLFNFASAVVAIVGAVLTLIIGTNIEIAHQYLIPLTIGGFIYIAAADLLPELKKEDNLGKSIAQLAMFLAGIGIMAALLLLE